MSSYAYRRPATPSDRASSRPDGLPSHNGPIHPDSFRNPWQFGGGSYRVWAPSWVAINEDILLRLEWHWAGEGLEVAEVSRPDPAMSLRSGLRETGMYTSVEVDGFKWAVPRLVEPTGQIGPDVPTYYVWSEAGLKSVMRPEYRSLCKRGLQVYRALAVLHGFSDQPPPTYPTDKELVEFAADCICACHETNRWELGASAVIDQISAMNICYEACGIGLALDEIKKKSPTHG